MRAGRTHLAIALLWVFSSPAFPSGLLSDCHRPAAEFENLSRIEYFVDQARQAIEPIKSHTPDPKIPSVKDLHLPEEAPSKDLESGGKLSPGLTDPMLEEARQLGVFEDNKPSTADVRLRKPFTESDKARIHGLALASQRAAEAKLPPRTPREERDLAGRRAYLRRYIDETYTTSNELIPVPGAVKHRTFLETGKEAWNTLYNYIEGHWESLLRRTPEKSESSLLPAPYPMFVANPERFSEAYYWDTYFTLMGFIAPVKKMALDNPKAQEMAKERLKVAQGVVENLLHFVHQYGHVPNGNRDYYLTRSQPPFLSSMVREVYDLSLKVTPERRAHIQKWMRERALPLLKQEYEFWMSKNRYDGKTGLNRHWDINLDRPERHGNDNEAQLANTPRDVRAAAESGEDFTDSHQGEASNVAPVLLNSMLFKMEKDMEWMAGELGQTTDKTYYGQQAAKREKAIRDYLYNKELGRYENYNLREGKRINVLIAGTFAPLYAGAANQQEADAVRTWLKGPDGHTGLERDYGIRSTELTGSRHQWDGDNGWAPQHMLAMQGLMNYGHTADAQRIGEKWVTANSNILGKTDGLSERINVGTGTVPAVDGHKYPVQTGPFGWTNGVTSWTLVEVLGHTPRHR